MDLTTSIIALMAVILIYIILISFFTLLFRITGLNRNKAFFQTISLITTVGFTTTESELITANKTRRRIAITCMIIGNILSLAMFTLLVDFISRFNPSALRGSESILAIVLGVCISIIIIFRLPFIRNPLENFIKKIGYKIYSNHNTKNLLTLLDNYGDYVIEEVIVNKLPSILKDKPLFETNIKNLYNINVMVLKRRNKVIDINKNTMIQEKDLIIVFGKKSKIEHLFLDENEKENLVKDNSINEIFVIENYDSKAMVEVKINTLPDILKDTSIIDSGLKNYYGINLILLRRNDELVEITKDTILQANDIITLIGTYSNVKKVFDNQEIETPSLKTKDE